jgi:hypothetical protein
VLALPESEQLNPLQHAPWHPQEPREAAQQRIKAPTQTKKQAAASFQDFYASLPDIDITIFTDGFKLANRIIDTRFAIY